ncbi:MAG: T9SS type A sorting domain-containing protein [Saprospiraceae bacterium]|nr:T9SS type A sorting domain-containing protein [Saprospiraceae bacterium]
MQRLPIMVPVHLPLAGGSTTVIWTVTSSCEGPVTCSASFTVTAAPAVSLTCPANNTQGSCQSQAAIDAAYTAWLNTATSSGGCNAAVSNNGGSAPPACGGSKTVTWTVTSSCEGPVTCSASFTVTTPPAVSLTCPANNTQVACQTQLAIDAAYTAWLNAATFSGGCNAAISNNGGAAPSACGGSKTVTWTVTSSCEGPVSCSAVFSVNAAPAVNLTCPVNQTHTACQSQASVDAAFTNWLTTVSFSGGCNAAISNNSAGAPPACGGSVTVTWTVTSTCEGPVTCSASFTVPAAPAVVLNCPTNSTQAACQSQASIDAAYNTWLTTVSFSGGCNADISNNASGAPPACGGSTTVIWTVTSSCAAPVTCSASFTVTAAPAVVLTCPVNNTQAACQNQAAIDAAYATWLTTVSFSGGCNAAISNNAGPAPAACGGSTTVTWTVTSSCAGPVTCSASFTVTAAPAVVLNCPANNTQASCQTQAAIDAAYSAWLNAATSSGGCNAAVSNNGTGAPPACGGSTTVTWTVTSSCEGPVTCSASFTVTAAPPVVLNCPANNTQAACQTQAAIDAAYNTWLNSTTSSGGCNATITNNGSGAPPACGGSTTVIWTVTSSCEGPVTCSASFTVTAAPAVSLTCPANNTQGSCQSQAAIDAAYTAWLNTATSSGGCNAAVSNNGGSAPPACGGSKTVTWTVTSSCEGPVTCSASFTVTTPPAVSLTCPANNTQVACQTQSTIDAAYTAWLNAATFSGGCNAAISNNGGAAPSACGGSKTVTWTVTSSCEGPVSCSAVFSVNAAPAVNLTCPVNQTHTACQSQASVDAAFTNWLTTVSFSGGCNAAISNNSAGAPPACGGSVTVTWTVTSTCEGPVTCSASFTVPAAPAVVLNCPTNSTQAACQSQASIDAAYNTWLTTVSFSGGCNADISNNASGAPPACGGSTTVIWTVTSSCAAPVTCSASFTVTAAPAVVLTCPVNNTQAACQNQAAIDAAYATWLTTVSFSGGCNAAISNNAGPAPAACGGSTTVTWTVTSSCAGPVTCSASFTVTAAPAVVLNCPANNTQASCQTQAAIDAAYSAWLNAATSSGGCNAAVSNNGTGAPPACGGSTTVTWTVTSSCEGPVTCSASFTVTAALPVVLNCPADTTIASCQSQAQVDAAYAAWLNAATSSGGCNATISNNGGSAPPYCGGSKTVSWTVTSSCEGPVTCTAVFSVTATEDVALACAVNNTQAACQTQTAIDAAYSAWLNTTSFSGGCNGSISHNGGSAPSACGGSKTVTWTVSSTCEPDVTCSAVFTVTAPSAVNLTCAVNQTLSNCPDQATVDSTFSAWLNTASFTGGCNAVLSHNGGTAPLACGGVKTVTWTVTSTCEPPVTCSAVFTVTTPNPVNLKCPSPSGTSAYCLSQVQVDNFFLDWLDDAGATGGCNVEVTNNNTGAPSKCGGTKTVTFTVTSSCDVTKTCSSTFTVSTQPPPSITCPPADTIHCDESQLPTNTGFAVGSDYCGNAVALTYDDQIIPGNCPGNYVINRTWTATDSCNNIDFCSQNITVVDTVEPGFNVPPNQTVYTQPTPSGNKVLVNYDFNSGYSYASLQPKLYSGIYSKIDTSSNPFLTVNGVVTGANAFDLNSIAGKGLSVNNSMVPGHWRFNLSGHNLPAFSDFEVYVQAYRKGNGSANDLLMEYSTNGINWTQFSTTTLVQGQWIECLGNITGANNPANLYIRVYYTGGNNQQTKELHIDNFQVRADNGDIPCNFIYTPDVTGYPTDVEHPCDPNPAVSYVDSLVFGECAGTQVFRTWTVTDFCGNSSTGNSPQVISVIDSSGPVIICPSNDTIVRKADTMTCHFIVPDISLDATAMDECTDSSSIINSWNNSHTLLGQEFNVGYHTITWTATDDCGNTSTCKYVLNVYETEPPVAKCKDFNIYLDSLGLYNLKIDSINNGSTDNCGIKSMKLSRYLFGCDDLPKRTVILTVTDSTGLSDTCTANLNIIDTIKPVIVCKTYNITLPPGGGSKYIHPDSVLLIKKDNCGIKTKVTNPDSITCKSPKNTTVTVTVTDVNGNTSTCLATVTIANYVDADCDGVINVCDVCPNGDDSVDNNGDGLPDCKYPPPFKQIKASWKCGTNPNRVYIAEIGGNGVCTTRCVRYADFVNNQGPNQFLGPCVSCPELLTGGNNGDIPGDKEGDLLIQEPDVLSNREGFRIIPNPNHGIFELIFNQTIKEGSVKIYNLLGEEVWKMQIDSETDIVQIQSHSFRQKAPGVYRVVVNNGAAKSVQSLIILQ